MSSHQPSSDLCSALAGVGKRFRTRMVEPSAAALFLECCLIALNKNPSVTPTGVCDTARCIIAKAILMTIWSDTLDAARTLLLWAGQFGGTGAAWYILSNASKRGNWNMPLQRNEEWLRIFTSRMEQERTQSISIFTGKEVNWWHKEKVAWHLAGLLSHSCTSLWVRQTHKLYMQ